jgi:fido (protein-threonine AMPylation protein)
MINEKSVSEPIISFEIIDKFNKNELSINVNGKQFTTLDFMTSSKYVEIENTFNKIINSPVNLFFKEENKKLNINKWTPLEVKNKNGENQVVYVKIAEFFEKTFLGQGDNFERQMRLLIVRAVEDRVGFSAEAGIIIEGREELLPEEMKPIESQAKHLTDFLITSLIEEGTLIDTRDTLHQYLDRPLSKKTLESLANIPVRPLTPDLLERKEIILARAGTSNTVKGKTGEGKQALDNWKNGDRMIREWVKEQKVLSLEDIQKLNRCLTEGLQNNGGEPGSLRENGVNIRPGAGAQYVLGVYVKEEMENFIQWCNNQLLAMQQGAVHPVEVAARAAQRFLSIHPFSDANGRTGRLIMDFILQMANLAPAAVEDVDFAVFGGVSEDNTAINVSIDSVVEKVKAGIMNIYTIIDRS